MEEITKTEEKKELSIAEMVELARPQLQGVKYFGIGVKNGIVKVVIQELSAYEFMPVSVMIDGIEFPIDVKEELVIKDLDNNSMKEAFYARKNAYLVEKGKEKQEYTIEVKSKKKAPAMVIPGLDMLTELSKDKVSISVS